MFLYTSDNQMKGALLKMTVSARGRAADIKNSREAFQSFPGSISLYYCRLKKDQRGIWTLLGEQRHIARSSFSSGSKISRWTAPFSL